MGRGVAGPDDDRLKLSLSVVARDTAWAASVRSGVLHRAWLALSKPLASDAVVGADRQTVPDVRVSPGVLPGSGNALNRLYM